MSKLVAWTLVVALLIACNGSGGDADPTATAPPGTAAPTPSEAAMAALTEQLNGDAQWAQIVWVSQGEHPSWACIGQPSQEPIETVVEDERGRYAAPSNGFREVLDLPDGDWQFAPLLPTGFLLIHLSEPPVAFTAFEQHNTTFDGIDYICVAPS